MSQPKGSWPQCERPWRKSVEGFSMDTIIIADLKVFYRVGVPEEERRRPQRLLISVEMTHDFKSAAAREDLTETIDYAALSERILHFGDDCHWVLIETLAADL